MINHPFLADAMEIICKTMRVKPSDLSSKSRNRTLVAARQAYCWIAVKQLKTKDTSGLSLTKIGQAINRDHSTVLYSAKKFKERCEIYESDKQLSLEIKQRFREKEMALHFEIEMKSDEIAKGMLEFIDDLAEGLTNIELHVENDAGMQNWRRKRVKKYLGGMKAVLSSYPNRRIVKEKTVQYLTEKFYETEKV